MGFFLKSGLDMTRLEARPELKSGWLGGQILGGTLRAPGKTQKKEKQVFSRHARG